MGMLSASCWKTGNIVPVPGFFRVSWRNGGWKQLPNAKLYGEYGLVNLVGLIPSIASARKQSS
jgi:hypothetical protein